MHKIAENLWTLRYPLPLLGAKLGRTVTVIRLASGKLVIHSTAPFPTEELAAIRELGEPGWLVDATRFHDSYAKEGRRAFPTLPYLAPEGFEEVSGVDTQPLHPPPEEWTGQLEVIPLRGVPKVLEHVFVHLPSRTLIVCDLLFNLAERERRGCVPVAHLAAGDANERHAPRHDRPSWTRVFARYVMRLRDGVGMSFFLRKMIRDEAAFVESVADVLARDFDRVVVGHGEIIVAGGKAKLRQVLARHWPQLAERGV